ncbi:MAG: hypothetical protein D6706_20540, partial [Chloroflexi bacterium]
MTISREDLVDALKRAKQLYQEKKFDIAAAYFRELMNHDETAADAAYGLGLITLARKDIDYA